MSPSPAVPRTPCHGGPTQRGAGQEPPAGRRREASCPGPWIAHGRHTSRPALGRTERAEEASMAFSGQILDNPISGERFIFHKTADDTAGELLVFDLVVDPDGRVPGGHVHPVQVEPTLRMEQLYETAVALAREGRTLPSGMPKPLDLALFMREFEQEVRARSRPAWSARSWRRWRGWRRAAVSTSATTRSRALGPDGPCPPILALAGSPALVPAPRARLPLDLGAQGRPAVSTWLADEVEQAAYRLTLTRR